MILVQLSDFTGQYALARSNNIDPIIQSYIDREEKRHLYLIFGKELADILITYIAASKSPTQARLNSLIDAFYLENTAFGGFKYRQLNNESPPFYESSGLKDLLICTIYYYYITETSVMKSTQSGVSEVKVDTSDSSTYANVFRYAEQKYNKSLYDTWIALWWRCSMYENELYPEYNGQLPKVKYGSLL